jgi:hypothetical protein
MTPMMARPALPRLPEPWTFWADTIVTRQPLGPVLPTAFSYSRKLSDFGDGTVTLPFSAALPAGRMLGLWSWRLWALYGGKPVWCGVPTGVADEGKVTASLTLTEITGYLRKRQWDVSPSQRFNQVEQTAIAQVIAAPVADVGVTIITSPGPGFPRDRTYEYLEGESRAELLTNLSNVISGPEFRTEYGTGPAGFPEATLRIAYPRAGQSGTGLGVTVPGRAVGYSGRWDADKMRTRTFAVGDLPEDAAEGALRPVAVKDAPQAGLPRLDEVDTWSGTILLSTLTERAATAAVQYAAPALGLTVNAPETAPPLDTYGPGDDVTVRIMSPLLSGGLDVTGRLTQVDVNAGDASVAWTMALTLPPPQPRESLTRRLGRIDALASALARRRAAPI